MNRLASSYTEAESFFPLLGNGKILCRFSGADLNGIRPFYNAPSLGALRLSFSVTPTEHIRCLDHGTIYHQFVFEGDHGPHTCLICDTLAPKGAIFLRKIVTDVPLTLSLHVPSYVRSAHLADYRLISRRVDALFLSARQGIPLAENTVSPQPTAALLFYEGNATFTEEGSLTVSPGETRLFFVGSDPESIPVNGENALTLPFLPPDFQFSLFQKRQNDPDRLSQAAIATLTACCMENGGVISSFDRPLVAAEETPVLIRAFLKLDRPDLARSLLLFWHRQYTENGFCPLVSPTGEPVPSAAKTLAGLPILAGALDYLEAFPDKALAKALLPMLTEAFISAEKARFSFSGKEMLLTREPALFYHWADRSLAATLTAADGAARLSSLCSKMRLALSHEVKTLLRNCKNTSDIKGLFLSPTSDKTRRMLPFSSVEPYPHPRFSNGICLGCYFSEHLSCDQVLENMENSHWYFCPDCLARYSSKEAIARLSSELERRGQAACQWEYVAAVTAALSPAGRRGFGAKQLASLLKRAWDDFPDEVFGREALLLYIAMIELNQESSNLSLPIDALAKRLLHPLSETGLIPLRYQKNSIAVSDPDPFAIALFALTLPQEGRKSDPIPRGNL